MPQQGCVFILTLLSNPVVLIIMNIVIKCICHKLTNFITNAYIFIIDKIILKLAMYKWFFLVNSSFHGWRNQIGVFCSYFTLGPISYLYYPKLCVSKRNEKGLFPGLPWIF